MPDKHNSRLVLRLKSAEGHLRAVTGMIEAGEPCCQVLHQLKAVQAALRAASCAMIDEEMEICKDIILYHNVPEKRVQTMERLVVLYEMMSK